MTMGFPSLLRRGAARRFAPRMTVGSVKPSQGWSYQVLAKIRRMSAIDEYLAGVEEPRRSALEHIRGVVRAEVPDADEGTSYGMPAFKFAGRPLVGFVAAKQHLSLFPFSPAVIDALADRLDGFELSKGTIRFSVERPIPDDVIRDIVALRMDEIRR